MRQSCKYSGIIAYYEGGIDNRQTGMTKGRSLPRPAFCRMSFPEGMWIRHCIVGCATEPLYLLLISLLLASDHLLLHGVDGLVGCLLEGLGIALNEQGLSRNMDL